MAKKGSSRKGERRRQGQDTSSESDEYHRFLQRDKSEKPIPIKLAVMEDESFKAYAQIPEIAQENLQEAKPQVIDEHVIEKQWNAKSEKSSWIWFALIGVSVFATLVYFISYLVNYKDKKQDLASFQKEVAVEEQVLDQASPTYIFEANTPAYLDSATKILTQYANAKKWQDIDAMIRKPKNANHILARDWRQWEFMPDESHNNEWVTAYYAVKKLPVLLLTGKKMDGKLFNAYFVWENEKLLLDWEATEGLCDSPMENLQTAYSEHPHDMMLRVTVKHATYFTDQFPEKEYDCFRATDITEDHVIFLYVKRNSSLYETMIQELSLDSILLGQLPETRMMVKIKPAQQEADSDQFFLTEILHNNWVMP